MAAFPELENPRFTTGGVPFEFLFESYIEQTNSRAANTFIKARVGWQDKDQFLTDVQGFSLGFAGENFLYRILPLQDPVNTNLFCTDVKLLDYASSTVETDRESGGGLNYFASGQDPSVFPQTGGMFAMDWAIYGLTFSRLPYFAVDNDAVYTNSSTYPNAPSESLRYNITAFRPRAREFTVNSYSLAVSPLATPPIVLGLPAFVMAQEMDLVVTVLQFPANNYPFTAIKNTIGRTNNAAIDLPFSFTPAVSSPAAPPVWKTYTFAQDTLLFRGVATDITAYQGPDGRWYYDIPYFFTYNPNSWLKLPNPDPATTGAPVLVQYLNFTPTKYLYDETDFKGLWKPEP